MISLPAQNPLFYSHPSLEEEFNRQLISTAADTDWLWRELVVSKDQEENDGIRFQLEWNRLLYHGLAEFFAEIIYYLAYSEALAIISDARPRTRLFHGSNVALRMVACWDRLGFFLYQRFDVTLPEKVYFAPSAQEMLGNPALKESDKSLIREMIEQYDKDSSLRIWRHEYIHRHGEYFRIDRSERSITTEYFPLDQASQEQFSQELNNTLRQSFPRLKSAMKSASRLID